MKVSLVFLFFVLCNLQGFSQAPEFLQIRKYSFENEEQLQSTETFLKDTYLPALKAKNFDRIGVFRNHQAEGDTTLNLYLLVPISSPATLYETDVKLIDLFPESKHYLRVENIILKSFEDMPLLSPSKLTGPRGERIYELRSYESANDKKYVNKVDMFNDGGEIELFEQLGFNAVFYGEVIAGSQMPNLMYMTTHLNKEARDANWKSFSNAPEWKKMSKLPKYQDNVSHIDINFLYPTSYSDY